MNALQAAGPIVLQEAESLPYEVVGWVVLVASLVVTVAWVWSLFR